LKELYTAIYRAQVDAAFVYTIVYCGGIDPRQCEALDAYEGLDLGKSCGTLQTWNLPIADLVMRHVHDLVVRLVLGDAASIIDDSVVRAKFESNYKGSQYLSRNLKVEKRKYKSFPKCCTANAPLWFSPLASAVSARANWS
jgi:hypothetical protein